MTKNLTPLYLPSVLPQSVSNTFISRYNYRNSNDLQSIDTRATLYFSSIMRFLSGPGMMFLVKQNSLNLRIPFKAF